ncbi:IS4 family transposase [Alienimonas sp. DA493]|uniref:IS4 family transposase n=1 Tax=Alienimonas sp. DA493 TaxID=3373605 RepID=UPI003753FC6E
MPGRRGWTPQRLACAALLIPWQETRLRAVAFDRTRAFLAGRKRWRRLPRTFTGFADALVSTQRPLAEAIWTRLRAQVRAVAPDAFRQRFGDRDFLVLAADGSRFEAPRTEANEAAFGSAGRRGTGPQVAATVLYHLGTGLPYAARLGAGTASELRHLDGMLGDLPDRTLLLADAGFPHFDLLSRLDAAGCAFLMRVGADRTLLAELTACEHADGTCGGGQQVWLWPEAKRRAGRPPLSLRAIELETDRPDVPNVYLLTNLSAADLPDERAAELYRRRWGVEVFFRTAKQTLRSRTLRSRNPARALCEAEWLILSVLLLGLLTAGAVAAAGGDPAGWSPARSLKTVRRRLRHAVRRGGRWTRQIKSELAACVIDRRPRRGPKRPRDRPQKKHDRPPRPPKLRPATTAERQRAQELAATKLLL